MTDGPLAGGFLRWLGADAKGLSAAQIDCMRHAYFAGAGFIIATVDDDRSDARQGRYARRAAEALLIIKAEIIAFAEALMAEQES